MSSGKSKSGRKAWKFLVFWFPNKGQDEEEKGSLTVENASRIPAASRKENAICQLYWPEKGPKKTLYHVKIVKMAGEFQTMKLFVHSDTAQVVQLVDLDLDTSMSENDAEKLWQVDVDEETGEILSNQKAFPSAILSKKKAAFRNQKENNAKAAVISEALAGSVMDTSQVFQLSINKRKIDVEGPTVSSKKSKSPPCETEKKVNADVLSMTTVKRRPILSNCATLNESATLDPPTSQNSIMSYSNTVKDFLDFDLMGHCTWDNHRFIARLLENVKKAREPTVESNNAAEFLKALLDRIDFHATRRVVNKEQGPQYIALPEHFYVNGPDKVNATFECLSLKFENSQYPVDREVQLFPAQQIFIPKSLKSLIDVRVSSAEKPDWKYYVDVVLNEIYGNNLRYMSCEGKRGTQGIHHAVRQGLYEYARSIEPGLSVKNFNFHVNHNIGNIKTAWKRIQGRNTAKLSKTSEMQPETPKTAVSKEIGGNEHTTVEAMKDNQKSLMDDSRDDRLTNIDEGISKDSLI